MSNCPREALFELLADARTQDRFFDHVADDVIWTVMGTHPLAGTYRSKSAFRAATFERLAPLTQSGVSLEVREVHDCGSVIVAELIATATAVDGQPFDNTYCWVCRFEGRQIVEVRAYLDSALVAATIERLET